MPCDVQTTLCRQFVTFLRHQATVTGQCDAGYCQHLFRYSHLKVQTHTQLVEQTVYIGILYVPPIFPQMYSNAVSTVFLSNQSCRNRIRVSSAPRLSQGCYVIYIYTE
jgi:hypothetical protein